MLPVSESIAVTVLSKTTVKPNRSLSPTASGRNVDGTGAFSTSDANRPLGHVLHVQAGHQEEGQLQGRTQGGEGCASGQIGLALTQTGTESGQTTDASAITIS